MANVRPFRSALSREGGQRSHHGATEVRRKGVSKGLTFAIYIYLCDCVFFAGWKSDGHLKNPICLKT